jgi:hypothetical protein
MSVFGAGSSAMETSLLTEESGRSSDRRPSAAIFRSEVLVLAAEDLRLFPSKAEAPSSRPFPRLAENMDLDRPLDDIIKKSNNTSRESPHLMP